MPGKQYLSIDPNAGAIDAPAKRYLSTDPSAGVDAASDPEKSSGAGAMMAGAGLAGLAAAVPVARSVAGQLANLSTTVVDDVPNLQRTLFGPQTTAVARTVTSPLLKRATAFAGKVAGPLNVAKSLYDVASGKESPLEAGTEYLAGEAARRYFRPERVIPKVAQVAQRVATPVAQALGGAGALTTAGGLAGLAGTTGFLGALQHDANRTVTTDYTKDTPDTAIARVFSNMRDSEKNAGRTLAEREDDPDDVMFRADDAATVTGGAPRSSVSAAVQAFFGRQGT